MTYKLGILDQSPIFPGQTAAEALQSSIHLAQQAEQWGYERYWVAEHHQTDDVAGSSPEVLISYLLAKTNKIKLGAGGVMLQHYSPYKVAENFHVLASLEPGRVELGIGKAPGGLSLSTEALRYGGTDGSVDFNERFLTLQGFLQERLPESHVLYGAKALPKPPEVVPLYLLGASVNSAGLAAEKGAHFVFARFLNGSDALLEETVAHYRANHPNGRFLVAVATIASSTQKEAMEIAKQYQIFKVRFKSGRVLSLKSKEQLNQLHEESTEDFEYWQEEVPVIAGTPAFVYEELRRLESLYQVDEFILHTPIEDEKVRLRSYELIGQYNQKLVPK